MCRLRLHPALIAPSLIGVAGYAAFCGGIAPVRGLPTGR